MKTIGPKTRISQPDDEERKIQRFGGGGLLCSKFFKPTPAIPTTLSTSNAIHISSIAPPATRRGDDHLAQDRRGHLKFRTAISFRGVVSIT